MPGARKNASLLCTRRVFVLAIVCIMFISWPLLVYAEAQAGFENFLHYDRAEEAQNSRKLDTDNEQKRSVVSVPKFWNRKFLLQGSDIVDNSKQESNHKLINLTAKGALRGSDGGKFPGRNSKTPYRRILIPATNVCTNKDISISQGPDGSSGIPRYFVQIVNTCMSDCAPSQVHVYCGWFASALLVNPNTFQRLAYNDCLVNGGRPLKYGEIVRFTYANSFMYPIRFKSASFCR